MIIPQRTSTPYKINVNFGDQNWLNSSNFNETIPKYSEKFDHPFRTFFYLVTCFLRVTVSLLCRLQAVSKIHVPIYLISEGRLNCSTLWPGTATKPWLGKHVSNINTCENWWLNFSILLELTRFAVEGGWLLIFRIFKSILFFVNWI